MGYFQNIKNIDTDQLLRLFFRHRSRNAYNYYSDIAWQVFERLGETGINQLFDKIAETKNESQLRAIIFITGCSLEKETYKNILKPYLADNRPLIVAETINSLARLGGSEYLSQILNLYDNSSAFIKGSILRYMRRLYPEQAKELLIASLKDKRFIVRENAVDELDELDDPSVINYIIPLLNDKNADVRQAAQTAILNLQQTLKNSISDAAIS